MPREEPFFKKCCFCVPLKSCLHTWACIKAIVDFSLIVILVLLTLLLVVNFYYGIDWGEFMLLLAGGVIILMLFIDLVFMVVLSVGLCKNDIRSLRLFYIYSLFMVVIGALVVIGVIIFWIIELNDLVETKMFSIFVVCGIINTSLDICMIFTLKSEIIKMRNKQQFEFVALPTLNKEEEQQPAKIELKEPFQDDEENFNV